MYQILDKEHVLAGLRERVTTSGTRCYASATIFQARIKLSELCVSSQCALQRRKYSAYTKLAELCWAGTGYQHYVRGAALQEVGGLFRIWWPPIVECYGDDKVVVEGIEALARIIEDKKNAHDPVIDCIQVTNHSYKLPPHPCYPAKIKKSLQELFDFRLEEREDGEPRNFLPVL